MSVSKGSSFLDMPAFISGRGKGGRESLMEAKKKERRKGERKEAEIKCFGGNSAARL